MTLAFFSWVVFRTTFAKSLKKLQAVIPLKTYFTKEWKTAARAVGGSRAINANWFHLADISFVFGISCF